MLSVDVSYFNELFAWCDGYRGYSDEVCVCVCVGKPIAKDNVTCLEEDEPL